MSFTKRSMKDALTNWSGIVLHQLHCALVFLDRLYFPEEDDIAFKAKASEHDREPNRLA